MADALARAKQRRAEALAAQEARTAAAEDRTRRIAERAKEHGLVEKTAGESGAAGRLRNKWIAFLETGVGKEILFVFFSQTSDSSDKGVRDSVLRLWQRCCRLRVPQCCQPSAHMSRLSA